MTAAVALPPSRGIAVLYPDIGEPYRSVFARMVEGIEDQARGRVPAYAVGSGQNVQEIVGELRRQEVRVVIALGRNGLKLAAALDRDIGIVAGGVLAVPEGDARNIAVFSLAPDPAQLFARLQGLLPAAKRVFVVYDPTQNAWLLRLAKEAASARGLELVAYEARDLKTALPLYLDIFGKVDPRTDVLWLPQDANTVDEGSVLPLVLQEAWGRNLAVFSSNVSHVRRGVLFALYPNNFEIGRSLANSALGYANSGAQVARGVTPMKNALMAVNVRTAAHLGINVAGRQQSFDMVFPEP